ncbi:CHAD domain-containing protein [Bradyrhizobium erythrophlei]|uniref:CHAD domain-containing protein n=1 Tax=Bradyrhizobium erythrophlei TaxID=1437360 RepID=UPI0009A8E62A
MAAADIRDQSAPNDLPARGRGIEGRSGAGRLLTKLDPHRRHKLRIQAKKLRYAAQFFETVLSGKKVSRLRTAQRSSRRSGKCGTALATSTTSACMST